MRSALTAVGVLSLAVVLFWAVALAGYEERPAETAQPSHTGGNSITMTVVYDNYPGVEGLQTAWGFGCVIELPETTILFDTGGDGPTLLSNMRKLAIDAADVDLVVLSHIHGDHTGGLGDFLAQNSEVTVCVPPSFPQAFKEAVQATGAGVLEVAPGQRLAEHVYTTGEMGAAIKEQALILQAEPGLVVITGCAHPGVVEIVAEAKRLMDRDIELLLGGFHLAGESRKRLESIAYAFEEMGVRRAGPCHCSGDLCRAVFADIYGDNYEPIAVGSRIEIPLAAAE